MATREHITQIQSEARDAKRRALEDSLQRKQEEQLLASLRFPTMFNKDNTMPDAYEKTYEWIFDLPEKHGGKWSDFGAWLEGNKDIYWINGKPGAGKSTLVNFLWDHIATKERLRQWKPGGTIILRFFITDQGSKEQRSFMGVLRALLFQLISSQGNCSSLLQLCVESGCNEIEQEWSHKRLRTVFMAALALVDAPICMFLDGLDELEADHRGLATWIHEVAQKPQVKFCIASRPYDVFLRAFDGCASLRLQDLTYADIRTYVEGCLLASDSLQSLLSSQARTNSYLIDQVVKRAEGVFLWARLAVQALLNGVDQYDTVQEIDRRLSTMPPDVENLYEHLWNSFAQDEPIYKETTMLWFETFFYPPAQLDFSLVDFALAVKPTLQKILCAEITLLNLQELLHAVEQIRKQMLSRSRGLLEVRIQEPDIDSSIQDTRAPKAQHVSASCHPIVCSQEWTELAELRKNSRVSFIHRSGYEFINSLPEYKSRLEASISNPCIIISYFQTALAMRYMQFDDITDDESNSMLLTAGIVERQLIPHYDFFKHLAELYKTDSRLEIRHHAVTLETGFAEEQCADYRLMKLFQRALISRYPLSQSHAAIEILRTAGSAFARDLLYFILKDVPGWTLANGRNVTFLLWQVIIVDIDRAWHVSEWWQKGLGVTLFFLFVQYGYLTGTSLRTPTGEFQPEVIAGDIFFDQMQWIRTLCKDADQEVVLTWTGSWFQELADPKEGGAVFPKNLVVARSKVVDLLGRCIISYFLRKGWSVSNPHLPVRVTVLVYECEARVWWAPGTFGEYQQLQQHVRDAIPEFGSETDPSSPELAQEWEEILEEMKADRTVIERADVPKYLGLDQRHPPDDIEAFLTWFDTVYERNEEMLLDPKLCGREHGLATPALLPKRGKYGGMRVLRGPLTGSYDSGL